MEYLEEHPAAMPQREAAMAELLVEEAPALRLVPLPEAVGPVAQEAEEPRVACGGV